MRKKKLFSPSNFDVCSRQYENFAKELEAAQKSSGTAAPADLFYMKQTISNACGTVALIHAVGNNTDKVSLGDGSLKSFLDSVKDASPAERAERLEKDDDICGVHDKVAQEGQTKVGTAPLRNPESD